MRAQSRPRPFAQPRRTAQVGLQLTVFGDVFCADLTSVEENAGEPCVTVAVFPQRREVHLALQLRRTCPRLLEKMHTHLQNSASIQPTTS